MSYVLGIDLGTTSAKVALLEEESQRVIGTWSKYTCSSVKTELNLLNIVDDSLIDEQDSKKILLALDEIISLELSREQKLRIAKIAICGQMHGIMLWNKVLSSTTNNCNNNNMMNNININISNNKNFSMLSNLTSKKIFSLQGPSCSKNPESIVDNSSPLPIGEKDFINFSPKNCPINNENASTSLFLQILNKDSGLYVSNLITWQDKRCTKEFLNELPKPPLMKNNKNPHTFHLHSGYGCSSLFWLKKYFPEYLNDFNFSGTIMDFLVFLLTNGCRGKSFISDQNAADLGYYNMQLGCWELDCLKSANFPIHLLPKVLETGNIVGSLEFDWHYIPKGSSVYVAMGDMQCSVISCFPKLNEAVLNMGTSAQLAFLLSKPLNVSFIDPVITAENNFNQSEKSSDQILPSSTIKVVPYFGDNLLAVGASLNGGNVIRSFVENIKLWISELGIQLEEKEIWRRLDEFLKNENTYNNLSLQNSLNQPDRQKEIVEDKLLSISSQLSVKTSPLLTQSNENKITIEKCELLKIYPTFGGERHLSSKIRGWAENISPGPISLGEIYYALLKGLVRNIADLVRPELLVGQLGIKRMLVSGSILGEGLRGKYLRQQFQNVYSLPVEMANREVNVDYMTDYNCRGNSKYNNFDENDSDYNCNKDPTLNKNKELFDSIGNAAVGAALAIIILSQ